MGDGIQSSPPQAPVPDVGLGGGGASRWGPWGVSGDAAANWAVEDSTQHALAATSKTVVLQQLMAANLALPAAIGALTATNKKLVDDAAWAKGTPAATPAKGGKSKMRNNLMAAVVVVFDGVAALDGVQWCQQWTTARQL